jgi:putative nucleotidyltransferase with HDIG domain
MNEDIVHSLHIWFQNYVRSCSSSVPDDQRNIAIKEMHTHEVCSNAVRIAKDLGLDRRDAALAEIIALFHDVGRFSQYRHYKTFDDSISINHAVQGAKLLVEHEVLHDLPKQDQDIVIRCVTLHNVFSLPESLNERSLLFAKLIRDADKLDIVRVVIEYCKQDKRDRAEAVALGLPDVPDYSPAVLACLTRGELARKEALTTLTDFKLLQLAWFYGLNFTCSLQMVDERGYIATLAAMLPRGRDIDGAVRIVSDYVRGKLKRS